MGPVFYIAHLVLTATIAMLMVGLRLAIWADYQSTHPDMERDQRRYSVLFWSLFVVLIVFALYGAP